MKEKEAVEQSSSSTKASQLVWSVTAFNCFLVVLSWTIWFGGDAQHVGVADRLFGHLRSDGFRVDIIWLFISNVVLGIAFPVFLSKARRSFAARKNAALCAVSILAFCADIVHALTSGVLDFG
jgi:hypothetical protein